jgi:hypothetical protein
LSEAVTGQPCLSDRLDEISRGSSGGSARLSPGFSRAMPGGLKKSPEIWHFGWVIATEASRPQRRGKWVGVWGRELGPLVAPPSATHAVRSTSGRALPPDEPLPPRRFPTTALIWPVAAGRNPADITLPAVGGPSDGSGSGGADRDDGPSPSPPERSSPNPLRATSRLCACKLSCSVPQSPKFFLTRSINQDV